MPSNLEQSAEKNAGSPKPAPSASQLPLPRSGPAPALDAAWIDRFLASALAEDVGDVPGASASWVGARALEGVGDVTSHTSVPGASRARARLVAKEAGVVAGLGLFARTFEICGGMSGVDSPVQISMQVEDGDAVRPGQELAVVEGDGRALLLAERTALNVLQHMSGVASLTARMVALVRGQARILDTRKTTPGMRILEKYAVRCGGGENHRFGLHDEILLKENHIELARTRSEGGGIEAVLRAQRAAVGSKVRITAEARDGEEARAAVRGGADVVMLDNMRPEEMTTLIVQLRTLAAERSQDLEIEASGGIDESTVAIVAAAGVDRISVGALTHSPGALDLSLYLEPLR